MSEKLQGQLIARLLLAQGGAAPEHPDAESLAAFQERRLARESRESVATHLAHCAVCREVLSLSAAPPKDSKVGRAYVLRAAVAAACVLVFAGTTSMMDSGVVLREFRGILAKASIVNGAQARSPQIAYAVAEVKTPPALLQWRIRRTRNTGILELSADGGKSWRAAKLDRPFDPEAAGFSGMDVWVKSRSGDMLLSRDAGLHWTALKSARRR